MSRQDELEGDRWRGVDEIEADAEAHFPLSQLADKVNSGLMVVLVGLYVGSRLFPQYAIPDVATAFPYVGAFGVVVLISAWGVDAGVLPTPGSGGKGGGQ